MKSRILNALETYASNYAISAAAAQMTEHIQKLSHAEILGEDQAQHRIAKVEEIRALTNMVVGSNMAAPELENATTAQQKQFAIERKWKQMQETRDKTDPRQH